MKIIAKIRTDFPTKFGIPRQSGLVDSEAVIVFEPEFRVKEALRGIEGYSHLWLIWEFSEAKDKEWSPTVRPPRLGGNRRMGVFATRSPYRPNSLGLSSVKLLDVEESDEGTVLRISGADLMNGTPIFDIKPYLPFTDCHTDAVGGFADERKDYTLEVACRDELLEKIPPQKRPVLLELLSQDPRPQYIKDGSRIFGFPYSGFEVTFSVQSGVLTVESITKI